MLAEEGRVVAVEPDAVWVETIRRSTCGTCSAQKACGHGILNKLSDGKRGYVRVLSGELAAAKCQVDDQVLISIPEEAILRGSFVAYVLPLLCMLASAGFMATLMPASVDLAAASGAVGGLAIGFALVRWHSVSHRHDPAFQPVLLKLVGQTAEPVQLV